MNREYLSIEDNLTEVANNQLEETTNKRSYK